MDAEGGLREAAGFAQVAETWGGHSLYIACRVLAANTFYNLT